MSGEKNPFAGIADAFSNDLGPTRLTPDALKQAEALFQTLLDDRGRPAITQPRYDVSFKCEACGRAGMATGPVAECPCCGHDGTLNVDRGWEGVLPPIRFFSDGRTE